MPAFSPTDIIAIWLLSPQMPLPPYHRYAVLISYTLLSKEDSMNWLKQVDSLLLY